MIRLFANMLAGHMVIFAMLGLVLLLGLVALPSVLLPYRCVGGVHRFYHSSYAGEPAGQPFEGRGAAFHLGGGSGSPT